MKIKIDDIDYDCEFQLPTFREYDLNRIQQKEQIDVWMEDWVRHVQESKLKEKRDLRKKKLENITKNT